MHWRAAFSTAARAQPPPIQPSSIEPSGFISAFAPALAAVTDTVRTTVASANVSPPACRCAARSRTLISKPREIGLERREALEIAGGREEIDEGSAARIPRALGSQPSQPINGFEETGAVDERNPH